MADATGSDLPSPVGEQLLDPFEFQPGIASRIRGLGGDTVGPHPEYAFHTRYVEVAEGPVNFIARFQGLSASYGTLHLRVHRFSQREGAELVLANSVSVELNRLPRDSSISIRFEGFQNVIYALYGAIVGETDAAAEGLSITLDRPVDPTRVRTVAAEARNTRFGTDGLKPTALLTSLHRALLASPICQVATEAQLLEPVANEWVHRLGIADYSRCDQWTYAYIAQALTFYGMMQAGAVGLALRGRPERLLAFLASAELVMVDACLPAIGEAEAQPGRGEPGEGVIGAGISRVPAPLTALPTELVNFDFLFSADLGSDDYSVNEVGRFVQEVMGCLRPGGLAVHVVGFDPSGADLRCFSKQDLDRLALSLIGGGHEVAQFRVVDEKELLPAVSNDESRTSATRVGLIARRARLPG